MPRTLAEAYVAMRPNMDRFGNELRRDTERASDDAGRRSGKRFGDGMRVGRSRCRHRWHVRGRGCGQLLQVGNR